MSISFKIHADSETRRFKMERGSFGFATGVSGLAFVFRNR
ncbi:hypothetical protein N825_29780 [Skermanella stibiiresistens SB22]|uniref:Uncharacterized protein n=1 Tax=Skermanella stibiiresistens SB22 TaxID=1385369 RepID=W9GXG4_9PROT|nr:hypothetical protein N825_29780 [Skermanella stibiiresistens SB22]